VNFRSSFHFGPTIPYKPKRSPSLVGGDWNMFYDVPFSWEWNVIIPTDEVHHFSEG